MGALLDIAILWNGYLFSIDRNRLTSLLNRLSDQLLRICAMPFEIVRGFVQQHASAHQRPQSHPQLWMTLAPSLHDTGCIGMYRINWDWNAPVLSKNRHGAYQSKQRNKTANREKSTSHFCTPSLS
jgi:hypothetical protein